MIERCGIKQTLFVKTDFSFDENNAIDSNVKIDANYEADLLKHILLTAAVAASMLSHMPLDTLPGYSEPGERDAIRESVLKEFMNALFSYVQFK